MKSGALAAMVGLPGMATAATMRDVTGPAARDDLAIGGIYGTTLNIGDAVGVNVQIDAHGETMSSLGFTPTPGSAMQRIGLSLNAFHTGLCGLTKAYLSDGEFVSSDDVMATVADDVDGFGHRTQDPFAQSKFDGGQFFVLLDRETEAAESYGYELVVSAAPVPVPAAGFLLLGPSAEAQRRIDARPPETRASQVAARGGPDRAASLFSPGRASGCASRATDRPV